MSEVQQQSSQRDEEECRKRAAALFMQHYPLIRHIALVSAPRSHLRDDIVNDAFVTFVEGSEKWDLEQPVKPLLRKIVLRSASVYWRKQVERLPAPLAELAEEVRGELARIDPLSDDSNLDRELAALARCLENLTPRCQSLFAQHYDRSISIADIARATGQSLAALYKVFLRARTQLKECIENKLREGGLL